MSFFFTGGRFLKKVIRKWTFLMVTDRITGTPRYKFVTLIKYDQITIHFSMFSRKKYKKYCLIDLKALFILYYIKL